MAIIADIGQRGSGRSDRGAQALSAFLPRGHSDQQCCHPPTQAVHPVDVRKTGKRCWGVVLDGAVYLTRALIDSMVANRYGRILFFTGEGAFVGGSGRAHVSAAKMGLVGFARGLASEFAAHDIRVNVVSPGSIDTLRSKPRMVWQPATERRGDPDGAAGQGRRTCRHLPVPGQ